MDAAQCGVNSEFVSGECICRTGFAGDGDACHTDTDLGNNLCLIEIEF